MEGLKRFLFRLIPFVTLLCFIAFGISVIFPGSNVTYLKQIIEIDEQTGEVMKNYYTFDIMSYLRGFTFEPLQKAFNRNWNFIDIDAWQPNTNESIAKHLLRTITNTGILIVNLIIMIINIGFIALAFIFNIMAIMLNLIGINWQQIEIINNIIKFSTIELNYLPYVSNLNVIPLGPVVKPII